MSLRPHDILRNLREPFARLLARSTERPRDLIVTGGIFLAVFGVAAVLLLPEMFFAAPSSDSVNRLPVTLTGTAAAAETAEQGPQLSYDKDIRPLLQKYCFECHQGADPTGGIDLALYRQLDQIKAQRKIWEKVHTNLTQRNMPPEDARQPTLAERERITEWLYQQLFEVNCNGQVDPGRVTIRRLNAAEYENTIRDLVGVDFNASDNFPSDDVGYGFDNIGDVLSLPPVLLEKYLAASGEIMDKAVVTPESIEIPVKRFQAEKIAHSTGGRHGDGWNLYSSGTVHTNHRVTKKGKFQVRARAYGQQAGPEPCKMAFLIDNKQQAVVEVKAEENNPQTYEITAELDGGQHRFAVSFINDYYKPENPPDNRDRNLVIDWLEVEGPIDRKPDKLPASHQEIFFTQPKSDSAKDQLEAARQIVRRFATRAFRRPAEDGEVDRFLTLLKMAEREGDSFEKGVQLALQAVLVSPHFLFKVERDRTPDGSPHRISDYELATRLSYWLWSSMPDEELFRLAGENKLRQPQVLEAQVRRMLKDPKADALVENFAGQWLQLRNLETVQPDPKRFPDYAKLKDDMRRETELYFAGIMREDRSLLEFLDSDYTYLNGPLADYYGIDGVKGRKFRRTSLSGTPRGGVLTQGSILTVTSNPTRTSPVKRGKWILENILATPPPPPPPMVEELEEGEELTGTLRERMVKHRENAVCASCHARMDPLGFGFENFDAIGRYRTKEGKFDIDASGELPDGSKFNGPAELRKILLAKKDLFCECLAEKMLTYALGRGLEYYDKCAVDEICKALAKNEYKFSTLMIETALSKPFQMRRGKRGEP